MEVGNEELDYQLSVRYIITILSLDIIELIGSDILSTNTSVFDCHLMF